VGQNDNHQKKWKNRFGTGLELEPNQLEPVPAVLVLVPEILGTEPRFRFQVLKNPGKNRTEPNSATLLLTKKATTLIHRIPSRDETLDSAVINDRRIITIKLPWTKTTGIRGGLCILTETKDDLCPVVALIKHFDTNSHPPPNTQFFAYRSNPNSKEFSILTKPQFMKITLEIYKLNVKLSLTHGHSYRIGAVLEYLAGGISPEMVMKLGGWSSLCFLLYWRRISMLVSTVISKAWNKEQEEFIRNHNLHGNLQTHIAD
jgi:hypothetical protein